MEPWDEETQEFYTYCTSEVLSNPNIYTKNRHWFLIPAVLIIVALSCLEKRRNIKPALFGGRFAPVRPFGFLDEPRNRWGIVCVFGSVTGTIIQVVLKTFDGDFPIWTKIFMIYLLCLEASVICFPIFACMTSRHKLVGAILGLVYSIGWFIFELFTTIQISRCMTDFNPQVNMNAHANIQELPVTLCNLLLILKFVHKLYKTLKSKTYKINLQDQCKLCTADQIVYVKYVLARPAQQNKVDLSLREKLRTRVLGSVPGFRFPITVLSATFMAFVMLYMVGLFCAEFMEIFTKGRDELEPYKDLLTAANVIAILVTFASGINNIWVFLKNYRLHMLSLYKGDKSFIPETLKTRSPNVYMAQGMRFLGTAIVGTFWGTVFCYLLVFAPLAVVMMVFRLLKQLGKLNDLTSQFEWAIYPVCMIVIFQIQTFLIGRFLIQPKLNKKDKHRPLAVDNRTTYDILSFFLVFLNASIGLFTFLKRILLGAFMGVFLIPRMDKSLLIRGYEAMDKCYVNYIGMIMVDVAHNHPVMRVFCQVVRECAEVTWYARSVANTAENPVYSTVAVVNMAHARNDNSIAKRRWLLAYTLIKNPSLVCERRRERQKPEVDLSDIDYSESEDSFRTADQEDACCLVKKWVRFRECRWKFPRNLSTNLLAMLVLLSFALLYAGVPLLIKEVQAASLQL